MPGAEESRVLPRPGQRALDEPHRQGHAAGDAVAPVPQVVEHGRVAGEIVARGDAVQVAGPSRVGRLARQHAVDRDQVVPLRVRHRPDDRQLVGPRRQAGKMLADLDPGTAVSIGLNSPRISSGASGFMSNESCCPSPPLSRITITDRARPGAGRSAAAAPRAASRPGSPIPSSPE